MGWGFGVGVLEEDVSGADYCSGGSGNVSPAGGGEIKRVIRYEYTFRFATICKGRIFCDYPHVTSVIKARAIRVQTFD